MSPGRALHWGPKVDQNTRIIWGYNVLVVDGDLGVDRCLSNGYGLGPRRCAGSRRAGWFGKRRTPPVLARPACGAGEPVELVNTHHRVWMVSGQESLFHLVADAATGGSTVSGACGHRVRAVRYRWYGPVPYVVGGYCVCLNCALISGIEPDPASRVRTRLGRELVSGRVAPGVDRRVARSDSFRRSALDGVTSRQVESLAA